MPVFKFVVKSDSKVENWFKDVEKIDEAETATVHVAYGRSIKGRRHIRTSAVGLKRDRRRERRLARLNQTE